MLGGENFSIATGLTAHEKGTLLEQDVRLEDGQFQLKQSLKIAMWVHGFAQDEVEIGNPR